MQLGDGPSFGLFFFFPYSREMRTPLVVKWLILHTLISRGLGSIPGQETKILHATQCGQNKTK